MKTASEVKIICNFTTCLLSFQQEETTELPFCAFYFLFGACPPSLCKWLHTSKHTISNLLRAVTLVERTKKKVTFLILLWWKLLRSRVLSSTSHRSMHALVSLYWSRRNTSFFSPTHSVLVRHERKQQYSNVFYYGFRSYHWDWMQRSLNCWHQ